MDDLPTVEISHAQDAHHQVDCMSSISASDTEMEKPSYRELNEPHQEESYLVVRQAKHCSDWSDAMRVHSIGNVTQ